MSFNTGNLALWLALANNAMGAQVVLSRTHYDLRSEVDYDAEVLRGTARPGRRLEVVVHLAKPPA
jgi:hypothetical protein